MLKGGYAATLKAIEQNQPGDAQDWLQVRAFRKSTKLNAARADATQALADWSAGKLSQSETIAATKADLLDAYNALLREALSATEKSAAKQIKESAAENAALAQGYFGIVQAEYETQRGKEQTNAVQKNFVQLIQSATTGDWSSLITHQSSLIASLDGFNPVPLSAKDIASKGAQMMQFLHLAQVEYEKGVRNGQVTVPLEYSEAKTFVEQSTALLNEIKPVLVQKDSTALAQLEAKLSELSRLFGKTADPQETGIVANASINLLKDKFGMAATGGDIPATLALLKQMQQAIGASEWAQAENLRLQAYAIFEVGAEQKLRTREPKLGDDLQSLFWQGTQETQGLAVLLKSKDVNAINSTLSQMQAQFAQAQEVLDTTMTPLGAIAASIAILIREGLEAVLVIAAMIGYLRATKAPVKAQTQVIGGAGLGIALSLVVWLLAQTVISITPVNRELFEGLIALAAAAVLFYVTNWLLHKVYVADWMTFVKSQVQKVMSSGAQFGLAALGFMVVFREGFETVLFFQALLFDAPAWAVLVGVVIGVLVIGFIAVFILKFSVKIQLKPFFTWTGILMLILAIAFVGIGLRNLQEAGWVGVTRFDLIPTGLVPALLGLFPTVETVLGQVFVVTALAVTFVISKLRTKPAPKVKAA